MKRKTEAERRVSHTKKFGAKSKLPARKGKNAKR